MADIIKMTVTGSKTGEIKGSSQRWKDAHEVLDMDHTVEIPVNEQTGMPLSKRFHKPMTITREVDKGSSYKFANAAVTNEKLTSVEFTFFNPDGTEGHKIKLEDAVISRFRTFFPIANSADPATLQAKHMEQISFVYQKIKWDDQAEDSWVQK